VHTWKDFFIHLAAIVIGLLITVGLEKTVECFHHRHRVAEMRKSLDVERRINANEFGILTEDFHRIWPATQRPVTNGCGGLICRAWLLAVAVARLFLCEPY
jgi:hypothetical protein